MCYDPKAQPPIPLGASAPAHGEDVVLTAADGAQFAAFVAHSDVAGRARVVIYPDVRGMHQFYKELALRFAEVGVNAIAVDYFGRTAGLTARDETFEFRPHVQQIRIETFSLDVRAAMDHMNRRFGSDASTYVIGFCMGGSLALVTGADASFGFAGLVPFYAGLTRDFGGRGTALDHADRVAYPVLGLFGGADQGIPVSDVHKLETRLKTTGQPIDVVIYPGAPHSFFDRKWVEFAEASADAWTRILRFIGHDERRAG